MMKNYLSKTFFALAFLFMSLGFSVGARAQTPSACGTNGSGAITDTSGSCYTQPDQYYMTVYKIGLCTAAPTAPNASTAFNASNAGNCTTIFENSAGSSVAVIKGVSTPLSGTMTKPPNGTYTAGYIEVAPQFRVVVSKTFNSSMAGSVAGNPTGIYCWSKSGDAFVWNRTPPAFAECGSSPGTAQITTQLMNTFSINSALFSQNYTAGGTTVTAHLVNSSYKHPSSGTSGDMNGITRLIGVAPLNVSITPTTRGFNTAFDVSSGSTLIFSGPFQVYFFGGGAFNLIMTPTN